MPEQFVDQDFGLPTIRDVFSELEKPGRDPRPAFKTATFLEGVETLKDLKPGMMLEGVVTNVAAFGAFVDIGVHQDGLVHISALSKTFVKDPRTIVKPGDIVRVKVMELDIDRKRIALSMRLDDTPEAIKKNQVRTPSIPASKNLSGGRAPASTEGALGAALRGALKGVQVRENRK